MGTTVLSRQVWCAQRDATITVGVSITYPTSRSTLGVVTQKMMFSESHRDHGVIPSGVVCPYTRYDDRRCVYHLPDIP